ncbi:class I mannose-6-phosphate isomerase [Roseomonas fluvialis]|uniref:Mannose-6-phosphate isomerase n=1 Tax=Roseomonas fluvialis TaxID=1750527 RepID=A0ABN6NVK5_9PROT|nr:class I mannose-6-phosphate isomerase [Roseomonas fluvialis]BDG70469.1 mannose-6-phosphate isomerase [Roseomonas fluvialis]
MSPTVLHIRPRYVERIWGRQDLGQWIAAPPSADRSAIGEAWLSDLGCEIETGGTLRDHLARSRTARSGPPLLAKLLFTSAPLSVQVHPTDTAAHASRRFVSGKDEAWHTLEAAPDAQVWIGLHAPVVAGALRAAAVDGTVLSLMRQHAVRAGETILVPAGTVHAIGAGLVLLEVQDPVDVTYRLYDYGRARPLQIEDALSVADLGRSRAVIGTMTTLERQTLTVGPRFVLERLAVSRGVTLAPDGRHEHILVALADDATLNGRALARGTAAFVPASGDAVSITGTAVALLHPGPGPSPCLAMG